MIARFHTGSADPSQLRLDYSVFVKTLPDNTDPMIVLVLDRLATFCRWLLVDHHLAHPAGAFLPSPFERALIMSFDGTGEPRSVQVYDDTALDEHSQPSASTQVMTALSLRSKHGGLRRVVVRHVDCSLTSALILAWRSATCTT